ncbi:unnamed protein product [Closterium sp. NIES-53]
MSCRCECAVCMGKYAAGERIKVVLACSHGFHADCIDLWLVAKTTCPICCWNLTPSTAPIAPTIIPISQAAVSADVIATDGGVAEERGGEGAGAVPAPLHDAAAAAVVRCESAAAAVGGETAEVAVNEPVTGF